MANTLFTVALFAALAIQTAFAGFAINTPALKQCSTSQISWSPSKGPYNLIAVDANAPCDGAVPGGDIGDFTTTSIQWKVTIAAGKVVQLSLVDVNDNEAWSGNITVAASDDDSCLGTATTNSATSSTPSSGSGSSDSSDGGSSSNVSAVGAANAGTNSLLNGASTAQASKPILVLSGLVAALALSL